VCLVTLMRVEGSLAFVFSYREAIDEEFGPFDIGPGGREGGLTAAV